MKLEILKVHLDSPAEIRKVDPKNVVNLTISEFRTSMENLFGISGREIKICYDDRDGDRMTANDDETITSILKDMDTYDKEFVRIYLKTMTNNNIIRIVQPEQPLFDPTGCQISLKDVSWKRGRGRGRGRGQHNRIKEPRDPQEARQFRGPKPKHYANRANFKNGDSHYDGAEVTIGETVHMHFGMYCPQGDPWPENVQIQLVSQMSDIEVLGNLEVKNVTKPGLLVCPGDQAIVSFDIRVNSPGECHGHVKLVNPITGKPFGHRMTAKLVAKSTD